MQMQILDCDYTLVNGKPLIRLFGKTIEGKNVCVFYGKFLPYFYVLADESMFRKIEEEIKKQFDIKAETVEKFTPIGYQEKPRRVLKIIGKDPSKTPEMREIANRFGTPYEADVLFKYRFMADMGLKGMCWVDVEGKPEHTSTVKCAAFHADKITPIERTENMKLKYMAFDIECISEEERIPEASKDPIIMISIAFKPDYKGKDSLVLLAKPFRSDSSIVGCIDEKDMIEKFKSILDEFDPEILIGYNINNFDLPYILERMEKLNIERDLGRAKKTVFTRKLAFGNRTNILGRVVVDPFEIIKKDPWVHFKRYDLGTVAKEMLGMEKLDVGGMKGMIKLWNGSKEDIERFINYSRRDSELALKLVKEKGLLDQFFELSKISGLLLQDIFGGQTQRHECKLLHEFRDKGFIMPCKPDAHELNKRKNEREKEGLKGAIVLEPVPGLYSSGCVLVLDFASLYPSIVKTFNICPTTLLLNGEKVEHVNSPYGAKFVKPSIKQGILPKMIFEMVETRRAIKKQLKTEKDPGLRRILNAKQLALKTMANSLYGYTGFMRSRLYVMDIANAITSFGRENILKTKKLIEEEFGVKVLYSDTDSVFINTDIADLEQAKKLGEKISAFATERLDGLILEFEKIFKSFLILAKKRYAAWSMDKDGEEWKGKMEMKGIETVRRDWCELTSKTMLEVLNIILKEQNIKKASLYVRNILQELAAGKIPLEDLTIVKGISKSVNSYGGLNKSGGKISPPAHVELAKKIMARDPTAGSMVGQRIGYVIIRGNAMLSKRAEDPAYVKEKDLEIDSRYYVENQVIPPIERIFDVCGITRAELIEGSKQKNLFEMISGKVESPEQMSLKGFDAVVCNKCHWSIRRPPLKGACENCGSHLYFSFNGSIGKFVEIE